MASTLSPSAKEQVVTLKVRGGVKELFEARDPEILVEGMSGTGKTRGILELLNLLCHYYPKLRALIVRRSQVTLTTTCLVTFNEKVLTPADGCKFFGGSKDRPAAYNYANGSTIVVGGMDNAEKILSSEYDIIYANEAPELGEGDWETLTSRLRNGVLAAPRIIGDCNPVHATHYLNKRCIDGKTRRIRTEFEDNPAYVNDDGSYTDAGAKYIGTLDRLTGNRYRRFRLGEWGGVENGIYDHFDRAIHVRKLPRDIVFVDGAIGADYGRVHKSAGVAVSVDQRGRRWVREAWAKPSDDHGKELVSHIGLMDTRYGIRRGRVDPNQDVLAGNLGYSLAKMGEGTRQHRVDITARLLNIFPGGWVPDMYDELFQWATRKPPEGEHEDSPGLYFVEGAPGIEELCGEMELYHYNHVVTVARDEMVVARIDDNMVAALEYALEELDEPFVQLPEDLGIAYEGSPIAKPASSSPGNRRFEELMIAKSRQRQRLERLGRPKQKALPGKRGS